MGIDFLMVKNGIFHSKYNLQLSRGEICVANFTHTANGSYFCAKKLLAIYSLMVRFSTARGSCTGLVTVGPTKVYSFKILLA